MLQMVPEPPEASFETPLTRLLRMRPRASGPHSSIFCCSSVHGFRVFAALARNDGQGIA
jgi:hypothetical protein